MTRRTEPLLPDLETGALAQSRLPVFVIDVAAGALLAANAAGREAWGLGAGDRCQVALDRAMPALDRLAQAAPIADATLTFWTARGSLRLRCRVQAIASAPGRFLVCGLEGSGVASPQLGARRTETERAAPARRGDGRDVPTPDLASDLAPSLARLAHEVRTPLSAAIAYAELLRDEHFGPLGSARYREYARNVYDSARLALSVVDGMLAREPRQPRELRGEPGSSDLRDLPELAFTDLDPAGVIDTCVAVARPLAERAGLSLTASYDKGTPRVIADEVSLKQMLLNLITNAIKFARPGDRVTLGAVYGADGRLRIEVADTGPGISGAPGMPSAAGVPGADADIAAPPLQPSAAAEGTAGSVAGWGIGLPLTRALAEANGAALIVDSAPGRGTRVTIAFGKDRVVPV
jgi:signal transduction histidine kinase